MRTTLISLHAQTSIHAGKGQDDSVVDLPIQREAHTSFPCVFGSSMKGALRSYAEGISQKSEIREESKGESLITADKINDLFGKEGDGDNGNAGALLIGDAKLLLLPIRSLTGQFKWVTCPSVLNRFKSDAKRFGINLTFEVPQGISPNTVAMPDEGSNKIKALYLQEFRFATNDVSIDDNLVSTLAACIQYENAAVMLKQQLAVIHDEDFSYLAQYTMPVNPHIKIDSATKTTVSGALWYEETLPSDSVMYVGIGADNVRKKEGDTADTVLSTINNLFEKYPWLQVGANETVGMGWFSIKSVSSKTAEANA